MRTNHKSFNRKWRERK